MALTNARSFLKDIKAKTTRLQEERQKLKEKYEKLQNEKDDMY